MISARPTHRAKAGRFRSRRGSRRPSAACFRGTSRSCFAPAATRFTEWTALQARKRSIFPTGIASMSLNPRNEVPVTRHAALGWLATAVILAAGLPLFLRMPLWRDVNLYDLTALPLLPGRFHYPDLCDTYPPG